MHLASAILLVLLACAILLVAFCQCNSLLLLANATRYCYLLTQLACATCWCHPLEVFPAAPLHTILAKMVADPRTSSLVASLVKCFLEPPFSIPSQLRPLGWALLMRHKVQTSQLRPLGWALLLHHKDANQSAKASLAGLC